VSRGAATDAAAPAEAGGPATCGARLRGGGGRCLRPAAAGKRRCRAHGGAARWGAPKGNRNAFKHGADTAEAIAQRRAISAFIRDCYRTIREIERG
jgi:glucans biosynthesis protein